VVEGVQQGMEQGCEECGEKCARCMDSMCVECEEEYVVMGGRCAGKEEYSANCKVLLPNNGCGICNEGYYRYVTRCVVCGDNCEACVDGTGCTRCTHEYFNVTREEPCTSFKLLGHCEVKTKQGCRGVKMDIMSQ